MKSSVHLNFNSCKTKRGSVQEVNQCPQSISERLQNHGHSYGQGNSQVQSHINIEMSAIPRQNGDADTEVRLKYTYNIR